LWLWIIVEKSFDGRCCPAYNHGTKDKYQMKQDKKA